MPEYPVDAYLTRLYAKARAFVQAYEDDPNGDDPRGLVEVVLAAAKKADDVLVAERMGA